MMKRLQVLMLAVALGITCFGQFLPESAQVILYFPHVADGGTEMGEQWQATLTFMNPSLVSSPPASVLVSFFRDDGSPLALDFGGGPSSTISFTLPPRGVRVFKSRMASKVVTWGWARALSSSPIQGTVAFQQFANRRPTNAITAQGTVPTMLYASAANPRLGIALANPDAVGSLRLFVTLNNREGQSHGQTTVSLPPMGHTAFNVFQLFPGLDNRFEGTVFIAAESRYFLAWTLNADMETGMFYTLPSGNYRWPASHRERIWLVFTKVLEAAAPLLPDVGAATLEISEERQINAYAMADGRTIRINLATSEMMADSDSELAFVIAHELAHIYQMRTGSYMFSLNPELDADALGTGILIASGYDPYGSAGVFGKLQMASGAPGLLGEILRDVIDPHTSYSRRTDNVLATIKAACSLTGEMAAICEQYQDIVHPHFPPTMPMTEKEHQ